MPVSRKRKSAGHGKGARERARRLDQQRADLQERVRSLDVKPNWAALAALVPSLIPRIGEKK